MPGSTCQRWGSAFRPGTPRLRLRVVPRTAACAFDPRCSSPRKWFPVRWPLIPIILVFMPLHRINLHLVSDATGETLNSIARATTAQFEHVRILYHRWSLIRTRFQLHRVLEGIESEPGPVLSTLVEKGLRHELETACERQLAGLRRAQADRSPGLERLRERRRLVEAEPVAACRQRIAGDDRRAAGPLLDDEHEHRGVEVRPRLAHQRDRERLGPIRLRRRGEQQRCSAGGCAAASPARLLGR